MRHPIDLEALGSVFPLRVARVAALLHLGLSSSLIADRCRPGGAWQGLLPGILLLGKAPPTREHFLEAALQYTGPSSMVTGFDALHLYGLKAVPHSIPPPPVHVLTSRRSTANPHHLLRVDRADRVPRPTLRRGFLTAPLARAAVDAVRRVRTKPETRAILEEAVHYVGIEAIRAELAHAPRGTALARSIVGESPAQRLERAVREFRPPAPIPRVPTPHLAVMTAV